MSIETLIPIALFVFILGFFWFTNRKADRAFASFLVDFQSSQNSSLKDIEEGLSLTRKQLELQEEMSRTLKEIKSLLEDRNS